MVVARGSDSKRRMKRKRDGAVPAPEEQFPALLRRWRDSTGITQAELSRRARVSRQIISKYENMEDPHQPTFLMLFRIARAFGVSPAKLLSGPEGSVIDAAIDKAYSVMAEGTEGGTVAVALLREIPESREQLEDLADAETADETVSVIRSMINGTPTFAVRVEDKSMWPTLIPGDIVLVNGSREAAKSQEIIVCLYRGVQYLRRYVVSKGTVYLRAENPAFDDVIIDDETGLVVGGAVEALVSRVIS